MPDVPLGELPVTVRAVIVRWSADALSGLLPNQTPPGLARVARFTPAKRARLGATALAQAVESDPGFRAVVAERAAVAEPSAGPLDPAEAAAAAHLLHLPTEAELVAAVRDAAPAGAPDEVADLRRELRSRQRELAQVTAERDELKNSALQRLGAQDEVDKLRRRLREQGTKLRQAELTGESIAEQSARELLELRTEVNRLTAAVTAANVRADRAQQSLGRLRDQAGQHKATADRRLELLLTTAEGAVSGLRREWDLAGGGIDPADVVAGQLTGAGPVTESATEPSRLSSWLGLPAAHLIVDGYNVSKTGYPDLTLAQQRERLVRQLAALSARTSAEVTVVFDGAAVAVPAPPGRGIRVLFSPPGVIADDVIRDLVAAEPRGRVIVVASSDREVADGVRRRGARTAASAVLLGLLS